MLPVNEQNSPHMLPDGPHMLPINMQVVVLMSRFSPRTIEHLEQEGLRPFFFLIFGSDQGQSRAV